MRTHLCELDETQLAHIVRLLRLDSVDNPDVYAESADVDAPVNMLHYLADSLQSCIDVPATEYDRNMIHGITL